MFEMKIYLFFAKLFINLRAGVWCTCDDSVVQCVCIVLIHSFMINMKWNKKQKLKSKVTTCTAQTHTHTSHGKLQFKLEMYFNISIEMCENYMFSITGKKSFVHSIIFLCKFTIVRLHTHYMCIENEERNLKYKIFFVLRINMNDKAALAQQKKYKESV